MPYRITTKIKIIIQYIIMDFFGEFSWEVIDCTTKAGRERYEQLFGHNFPQKPRARNQVLKRAGQRKILQYLITPSASVLPSRQRAPYKRHYNPAPSKAVHPLQLPLTEQSAIESQDGFDGYLYHLFLSGWSDFFKREQQMAKCHIFSFNCQWDDIIRLDIARTRLGFNKLSSYLTKLESWEELRIECGIEDKQLPLQSHYLKCLAQIGERRTDKFFHCLREEGERYHLYDTKMDIWDGRFLKSYSSGQSSPTTGQVSDPDVGKYVHGKKFHGIGYLESRIINARFRLPKYYLLVNPQWNDNQTFQTTFQAMLAKGISLSDLFLADGGPKGLKSYRLVSQAGSTPIFPAPKNAAGIVLTTKKQRLFYERFIPEQYHGILDPIYDNRTRVEQSLGYDTWTYEVARIPHLGKKMSTQFVGLLNCQPLLTALTAIKTDQFHLVTRPGAFRRLGLAYQGFSLEQIQTTQEAVNQKIAA